MTLENLAGRFLRVRPSLVLKQSRVALRQLERRLNALGPEQVLSRGYSITTDAATGKIIRRAKDAKAGQRLRTRVKEGEISSKVEK